MGRSVSVPTYAVSTAYISLGDSMDTHDWDWFVDDIRAVLKHRYPSLSDADRWLGREDHVIASNCHADIVLCEYCGLVSLSIVPTQEDGWHYGPEQNLHDAWCNQVADGFRAVIAANWPTYNRIGTMSNGVSVYQPA